MDSESQKKEKSQKSEQHKLHEMKTFYIQHLKGEKIDEQNQLKFLLIQFVHHPEKFIEIHVLYAQCKNGGSTVYNRPLNQYFHKQLKPLFQFKFEDTQLVDYLRQFYIPRTNEFHRNVLELIRVHFDKKFFNYEFLRDNVIKNCGKEDRKDKYPELSIYKLKIYLEQKFPIKQIHKIINDFCETQTSFQDAQTKINLIPQNIIPTPFVFKDIGEPSNYNVKEYENSENTSENTNSQKQTELNSSKY
ncbi:Hypothetical_protein [Hexamita inflata]|uniref:Hypothetical_protein n=1 Tax=Hexamita inflata TaxID=28002 RepID=A0AA86QP80_9EUKA|nr:Hypothetical protein HINF_LOCUS50916 [Hexamita inflata]